MSGGVRKRAEFPDRRKHGEASRQGRQGGRGSGSRVAKHDVGRRAANVEGRRKEEESG